MHAIVSTMLDLEHLAPQRLKIWTRSEYDRLVALGAFHDERIELLRGQLVTMSPQGEPHAGITAWFMQALVRALDPSYEVRAHSPFAASDDSEPEPDVSVSCPEGGGHPRSALLIIEVSDSSLRIDRSIKAGIYARNGVPEYWIVDVQARAIEIRTQPADDGYAHVDRVATGLLRPTLLPSVVLDVLAVPWPPR